MNDTVIILQENSIIAAQGKYGTQPRVHELERIAIDGFGDSFLQWKEALRSYQMRKKPVSVTLVLPASISGVRVTQVPYATGKQLSKMAGKVLEELEGDLVADYGVVLSEKQQGVNLCLGSVERPAFQRLYELCQEIQLPVERVTVPMEGYLRYFYSLKQCQGKTSICMIFEGSYVTSLLYNKGLYCYSTRSRIFSERGTYDFGNEIVRILSGIRQFYSTLKETDPITDVYYTGCQEDDFAVSLDEIREMQMEASSLEAEEGMSGRESKEEYLSCLRALSAGKGKNINLCEVWKRELNQSEEMKKASIMRHLLLPGIVFAMVAVTVIGVNIWNGVVQNEIRRMESWIQEEEHQEAYGRAQALEHLLDAYRAAVEQAEQGRIHLETYPELTREMVNMISDVGGRDMEVKVKSLNFDTGELTFDAISRQVIDIPGYVEKLDATGLFASVNYTGYVFEDDTYTLALTSILRGQEQKGGE